MMSTVSVLVVALPIQFMAVWLSNIWLLKFLDISREWLFERSFDLYPPLSVSAGRLNLLFLGRKYTLDWVFLS